MNQVRIAGTGIYVPGEPIDNQELMSLAGIEFDAARYEEKLGIRARHLAAPRGLNETTADFATHAARAALADAGISAAEVDLFIVATDTPEFISPSTAVLVQGRLQGGRRSCGAFDINATCAGFSTAFDVAARMVGAGGTVKRAVVIGVYNMNALVRPGDPFGWSIFADGAGAFVLERTTAASRYEHSCYVADGTQWDYVGVYAGGTRRPITAEVLAAGSYGLELLQRLPGDRNVKLWPPVVADLLAGAGRRIEQLDHIIFTQINRSVILEVMSILGLPSERTTMVMDRYGYTGSACIPMAFNAAVQRGAVKRGDLVAFVASGAGLAVAANLFVY